MAQRANVLRAYRELIDLAKRLPSGKRNASIQEAQKAMRANRDENDPVKQNDMLKELVAKVSFLRMTTPKTYRDRCTSSLSMFFLFACSDLKFGPLTIGPALPSP